MLLILRECSGLNPRRCRHWRWSAGQRSGRVWKRRSTVQPETHYELNPAARKKDRTRIMQIIEKTVRFWTFEEKKRNHSSERDFIETFWANSSGGFESPQFLSGFFHFFSSRLVFCLLVWRWDICARSSGHCDEVQLTGKRRVIREKQARNWQGYILAEARRFIRSLSEEESVASNVECHDLCREEKTRCE